MNFRGIVGLTALGAAFAANAFEVENVTARQHWPWDTCIDVDFEIVGASAGDQFVVDVTATYEGGAKTIAAKSYKTDPVALPGKNRLVWDFAADAQNLKTEDLAISVTATPFDDASKVYCVIDLSDGKDATKYPVRYTREDPVHTPKNTNDVCKLTELWLRRIHPAGRDFAVGTLTKPTDSNTSFYTRLTKDYYMAVFETTQQQWFQLSGTWPSTFSNLEWRATRPVQRVIPSEIRGVWGWPGNKSPKESSILQKLRDRTGIAAIDLPTEAQYQFAVNPGPTFGSGIYRYYNPDGSKRCTAAECSRTSENVESKSPDNLCDPESGTACVGSYMPNSFGLYDLLGNVWEYCLDPFVQIEKFKVYYQEKGVEFPLCDPDGLTQAEAKTLSGYTSAYITLRGGSYSNNSGYSVLTGRKGDGSNTHSAGYGFRFCITCE